MRRLNYSSLIEKYEELLEESAKYKQPKREKTVFSIGGRGHYENPVSDVLAFFTDPREEHQFGTLLLSSILRLLNIDEEIDFESDTVEVVEREAVTQKGNRIDLVIAGEGWVLAIENKIYHELLNPLEDYEEFIQSRYPGKAAYYAILSINKTNPVSNEWKNILYKDLHAEVKNNAGPYMFNSSNAKWSFFLNDFLLNIEELIGENEMDHEMIDFVEKNYAGIQDLIKIKEDYINALKKNFTEVIKKISATKVIDKTHTWNDKTALRFFCPKLWEEKTNLVLVILPDGKYKVYFYVYGIEEEKQESEIKRLHRAGYRQWKEGRGSILCFKTEESFDLDGAKEEFEQMVQHLNWCLSPPE
ncbi:PD-(D/E)XK nuclease family protein [Evansella sp. LMS18]|uniref:PD-(D/E)XK nuclease family protein n=1 Tax=Evansella sp. LMS18 TaxID=2924033 RepID=UPI0020D091C7|nr:PD-(D/E)XK nuclease family protein [Evansella sp. LMS18]UTR10158.1 PD-(D/E)XK nuclease family protein [Evansella sp. LMS18]